MVQGLPVTTWRALGLPRRPQEQLLPSQWRICATLAWKAGTTQISSSQSNQHCNYVLSDGECASSSYLPPVVPVKASSDQTVLILKRIYIEHQDASQPWLAPRLQFQISAGFHWSMETCQTESIRSRKRHTAGACSSDKRRRWIYIDHHHWIIDHDNDEETVGRGLAGFWMLEDCSLLS